MKNPKVLILLAAYNGEAYIRQMIMSVLDQSYDNFQLVLSDDGSTDDTAHILEEYAQADPGRVIHYRSGQRFGCAQKHFMHLISRFQDAPYIMFCDQDDVWHTDKVEKTLELMMSTEVDAAVPALVHTDLRVVDGEGNQIAPSFCAHSAIDGNRMQLRRLLVQNVVTGCTTMINSALADLACRGVGVDAMQMHDWWLALLASSCGTAAFLDEATIDYRQHNHNSVGAKNVRSVHYIKSRLSSGESRKALNAAMDQAQAFLDCYADQLSDEQQKLIRAFVSARDASVFYRDKIFLKYGLLKKGWSRICAQLLNL